MSFLSLTIKKNIALSFLLFFTPRTKENNRLVHIYIQLCS